MNRNHGIAIALILIAFVTLIVTDYNKNVRFTDPPSTTLVRRWQIAPLNYCNANNLKPCVVSFSRTTTGMVVNLTLPSASYPDFYLLITRATEQYRYECQPVEEAPTTVWCVGLEILPGEPLQFAMVTLENNTLLAEGNFAILGLMLATPQVETITPSPTITPPLDPTHTALSFETTGTASPTALSFELATPTATEASYPNPSYPNPSYP